MKKLLNQVWITLGVMVGAFAVSWVVYMPDGEARGVWRATSGGQILSLGAARAQLYSETPMSCTAHLGFPAHLKLVELAAGTRIDVAGDTLALHIDGALAPTTFTRIAALPDTCTAPSPDASPRAVFEALWHTMDAHYPFFAQHDVDWAARRAPPSGDISDAALFALLSDALAGLDDANVQLVTPLGAYPAEPDRADRAALVQTARRTLGTPLTPVELTGIEFTLLPDRVGYILMRHMAIDTPLGATSQSAMALAFEGVRVRMDTARALIIDLRYAPGASEAAAFGIASHFTAQPLEVFEKTTQGRTGANAPVILAPFSDTPLARPLIVLTGPQTGPAAALLVMALRAQPLVTVMGTAPTQAPTDSLFVTLPNGWQLGLPHSMYSAVNGTDGTPDIVWPTDSVALERGTDLLLRSAFTAARDIVN